MIEYNVMSPLRGPVTYCKSRLARCIHVALSPKESVITGFHKWVKTILFSCVHLINRIVITTLTNLDEYILHWLIHSWHIDIATVCSYVSTHFFAVRKYSLLLKRLDYIINLYSVTVYKMPRISTSFEMYSTHFFIYIFLAYYVFDSRWTLLYYINMRYIELIYFV